MTPLSLHHGISIDAHHHLWDRSRIDFAYQWLDCDEHGPIAASHLPDDLWPNLKACGIDKSVVVQTQHLLAENDWALALAAENDWIAGVVGWVDLASDQCESQLLQYCDQAKFVGIRHVIQDEPDDFLVQPEVTRGLQVLAKHQIPFDLLVYQRQLHHAPTIAKQCPDLKIVLDHLGKPRVCDGRTGWQSWRPLIEAVADCENIYCKLSGLVTEANWRTWSPIDLRPFFDTALELFGPQRCMFGSDWPVSQLAGEYSEVYAALRSAIDELSENERNWILGRTAIDFYSLRV